MVCCLTVSCHYLNQCWPIFSGRCRTAEKVHWKCSRHLCLVFELGNYILKFTSSGTNELHLPGTTCYVENGLAVAVVQQALEPLTISRGPALFTADVELPHSSCFTISILIRETLGCYTQRSGTVHAVNHRDVVSLLNYPPAHSIYTNRLHRFIWQCKATC